MLQRFLVKVYSRAGGGMGGLDVVFSRRERVGVGMVRN